jgi:hypothetical protein
MAWLSTQLPDRITLLLACVGELRLAVGLNTCLIEGDVANITDRSELWGKVFICQLLLYPFCAPRMCLPVCELFGRVNR